MVSFIKKGAFTCLEIEKLKSRIPVELHCILHELCHPLSRQDTPDAEAYLAQFSWLVVGQFLKFHELQTGIQSCQSGEESVPMVCASQQWPKPIVVILSATLQKTQWNR